MKITTGLWIRESKDGNKFFSGTLDLFGWNLAIFKNNKKEPGSKQPDYNLVIERKKDTDKVVNTFQEVPEDDIPF